MRKFLSALAIILCATFVLGASGCEYEEAIPTPTPTPPPAQPAAAAPAYSEYEPPDYEPPPEYYDDPGYSDTQYAGGDLDCADVSYAEAQSYVAQGDPYGFDADGDGEGCEWNR